MGAFFCRASLFFWASASRSYGCPYEARAWVIAVGEFNASRLECLLKQRKCGPPGRTSAALKHPNRGHPQVCGVCELLLTPIQQASCRPALGSCDHGSLKKQTLRFGSIRPLLILTRPFNCFYIVQSF